MWLDMQLLGDASKNCIAWVRGQVVPEDNNRLEEFLCLDKVATAATGRRPRTLQFGSALWTLQEKLGLRIWTDSETRPDTMLLLMESRNYLRLDRGIPLEKWNGKLYLEPFNIPEPKWFWFQLDFDKVFER